MLFSKFSQHLLEIEKTSSRLEMTSQLASLFSELENEEIPMAVYLSLGKLVPAYQTLEFQLSAKMVLRVLSQQMAQNPQIYGEGTPAANLFDEADSSFYEKKANDLYKKIGDIGQTSQEIFEKTNQVEQTKEIADVHQELKQIAKESGSGSQERKTSLLLKLFQSLDPVSARFVSRIVVGKLRLGFSTMTILDALSWVKTNSKEEAKFLEELFQRKADLGLLAQLYLGEPSKEELSESYQATFGIPIVPALCQRLNTAQEIIDKQRKVIVEPKYDGLRVQIHIDKNKKEVRSFTRNLEETSHMFPELENAFNEIDCDSCILDGEVVGVNKETGAILSFQETSKRRRKHGVSEKAAEIPVVFYVFDILQKNDESLLDISLTERKALLAKITKGASTFINTPYIVTTDAEELKNFHEEQLALGLEGAVMKKHDSPYKSGRKGWRWVKIKESEGSKGKLNDTLDCVVMGYYRGRGKRAAFGLGAFLVGVVDEDGKIKTVAKIGTGLTDAQFKEFRTRTDEFIADKKPDIYKVHKNLKPDIWVEPKLIVEIAADEITTSPVHSAGKALRFPRLVQFRDDKTAEQATTVGELETITHLI